MSTADSPIVPGQPAKETMQEASTSKRVFGFSALVVTPIAFVVALLIALSAGWQNALLIALLFAGFAAAFFFGLNRLAGAVRKDERRAVDAHSRGRRRHRGSPST